MSDDFDGNRVSRVLAVVISLAEFPWFSLFIICVRTDIWACRDSRFALIFSSLIREKSLI